MVIGPEVLSTRHVASRHLLKWLGYGQEHNSWEPEANVANCPELIGEYWQRIARAAGIGAVDGLQDTRVRRIR